jgi:DNA-binding NarL/FixJ family response regulator
MVPLQNAAGTSKPCRVLVVDDYEPWRRLVYSTLQMPPTFQVIGEVSDGLEAVQKAQELQPDLIVLDIGLPTLNGIEAAKQIRTQAPQSKILFLSENRSLDIAREALRSGGSGYVIKSNAARELLPAVEAVLQGKPFLSSGLPENIVAPSINQSLENPSREIRLYPDDAALVDGFARSIANALINGNVVVIAVATQSQRTGIFQKLSSSGVDVAEAIDRKRYVPLDVAHTHSTFFVASSTHGYGFTEAVPRAMSEALRAAKQRHLRAAVG